MFKIFENQKYPAIVLFLGFLLILIGFVDVQDISKFKVVARSSPIYLAITIGSVLILSSFLTYLFDEVLLGWSRFNKVKKLKNGYQILVDNTEVNVLFGRIEEIASEHPESTVVLPANEYFDDECIDDSRSALGAYINNNFVNQSEEVKNIIKEKLVDFEAKEVEKEIGCFQKSYGVGTGILLKEILDSKQSIVLLAVTTKRAGEGLRSELSYIYQSVKELFRISADGRINSFCLPVMGSGHGGLKKEVALFGLLLAIFENLGNIRGHHIKKINIVVYRLNENSKPEVSKSKTKRLLSISSGMLS